LNRQVGKTGPCVGSQRPSLVTLIFLIFYIRNKRTCIIYFVTDVSGLSWSPLFSFSFSTPMTFTLGLEHGSRRVLFPRMLASLNLRSSQARCTLANTMHTSIRSNGPTPTGFQIHESLLMSRVSGSTPSPSSRVSQAAGFTVLRNVYSVNGTLYLVTERRDSLPNIKYILSTYADIPGGKTLADLPTQSHIRVIDPNAAIQLFGFSARELRGTTWLCNDPIECGSSCLYTRAIPHQLLRH